MKEKVVISLNQEEQIELERITTDLDEKQALEFLKQVLKRCLWKSPKSFILYRGSIVGAAFMTPDNTGSINRTPTVNM